MTHTEELAWLAGLLDGEGSFLIRCAKGRNGQYRWFRSAVTVAMTNEECIHRAARLISANSVGEYYAKSGKRVFRCCITCHKAAELCRLILPFLAGKCTQAEAIIALDVLNNQRRNNPRPLTDIEYAERLKLYDLVRSVNANRTPLPVAMKVA